MYEKPPHTRCLRCSKPFNLNEDRKTFIPLLLNALKDKHEDVRRAAAQALPEVLQDLQPQDRKSLIHPFQKALQDDHYSVRKAVVEALQQIEDKIWQSYLQHELQAKQQQGLEDVLKAWAYLLLRGSVLICFNKDEQSELPSYTMLIKALKEQANTWGWPVHTYSAKPLPDDFVLTLPKLPVPNFHPPLAYTFLHNAAQQDNLQALEKLWKDNTDSHNHLNDQHNEDHLTPLLCALQQKQWEKAHWLIDQGAWIDVADRRGYSPLQKIITSPQWHQNKEVLALIKHLLQKRTFFSKDRVHKKVQYVIEQGLDKETKKRKPLAQKTYHKHLCIAVTGLLGEDVKDFQQVLLKHCDFYKAASKNVEKEKRENIDKEIDYTTGLGTRDFLPYRVALLFDVLVKFQQGDLDSERPETSVNIYQAGLQELQTQLTTFWANKLMETIFGLRFDLNLQQLQSCYQAWASGIIHCLPNLTLPQEMSLALSDKGHCIYVSLTHTSAHYIIRVDNRWINTAPKKSHPITQKIFYEEQMDALQPYMVAYFPLQGWDRHKQWLLNYIALAGRLNGQHASQVIPHLYQTKQKAPKQGSKPTWVKLWPWRPLQTTADNCFMRSHNVGYRIRMGNELYEWFRQKALGSYLLEQKFVKNQPSSSSDNSPKQKEGNFHDEEETKEEIPLPQPKKTGHKPLQQQKKNMLHGVYTMPTSSKQSQPKPKTTAKRLLPTHQEVMQRFAKQLKVNYDAIYSGIAAEQSLVRYAGITQSQQGATFGRDSHTGYTWFKLCLSSDQANLFIGHYLMHHAGWIQDMKLMEDDRLYLLVDTAKLYDEVIPQLKGESSKVDNKQAGGSNNVVEKKKLLSKKAPYSSYKEKQPENAKDVSSKKLPTHQKVMQRFAKQLKVHYDAIYSGIAAEQSLVRYAGITQFQQGATFGRDSHTGYTWFKLKLTRDEVKVFSKHYNRHHPDAIKKGKYLDNGWVRITLDTQRLYDDIIPQLNLFSSSNKPKKDDNKPKDTQQRVNKKHSSSQKPESEDTKYIPPKRQKRKKITATTSTKELPTHQEVVQRFSQQIRINDHNTMLYSKAAQQALVGYAGIGRSQQGARFDRDSHTKHTCFILRLSLDEAERFMNHYRTHHAGCLQDMRQMQGDWFYILLETAKLYDEVIPQLKPSWASSKPKSKPKKVDNRQKEYDQGVMNTNKTSSKHRKQCSSKRLPTHQEVMNWFGQRLRVGYNAIYSGIVAEQAIVRYAGLTHVQTGAMFRRDSQTGRTWFKLRLNSYEADLFISHYQTLHPDAIKKRETLGNDWVRITFDTQQLYEEIIPKLV